MDGVTRIGVSLEPELLEKFDRHIESKGYVSRSEAIRDLIRELLSENEWKDDNQHMVGAIILIFDSGVTGILEKIGNVQTEKSGYILSSNRTALDDGKFMDIISGQADHGVPLQGIHALHRFQKKKICKRFYSGTVARAGLITPRPSS